jgi:tRNA-2-methylthio-N6-dimethylallyladenosine synthase
VDFVFRITDLNSLGNVLKEAGAKSDTQKMRGKQEASRLDYLNIAPKYSSSFQAVVPIQIGCDKYCTYCIVPYARGREQSRPMKDILAECKALVKKGCKEITLVGQTVNSYGNSVFDKQTSQFKGIKEPFVKLLTEIDKLHTLGLDRLRFTSPHPKDFTDELIKAHIKLKTLCPHFHLPIQSGSDEVLARMNRKYSVKEYKEIIKKIRKILPLASITTDIIVGFCGETKEQFMETYKLHQAIRWDMSYLARYSPRPQTVSHKYFKDDVTRAEKARRWHKLNGLLEKCALEYNKKLVGKTLQVLVERCDKKTKECEGKSRENKVVQFGGAPAMVGKIVDVKATKALQWLLKGKLVSAKKSSAKK